ncbi:hypothetical protein ABIE18_004167 [Arthrobacter sp. 2762]
MLSHLWKVEAGQRPAKDPWVLAVIATLIGWVLSWRDIRFI